MRSVEPILLSLAVVLVAIGALLLIGNLVHDLMQSVVHSLAGLPR